MSNTKFPRRSSADNGVGDECSPDSVEGENATIPTKAGKDKNKTKMHFCLGGFLSRHKQLTIARPVDQTTAQCQQ